jgi:hypothetical protein
MAYALIIDDTIESVGSLPKSAQRLDTEEWVVGLRTASPDLVAACGYVEVVETPQPVDPDYYTTWTSTIVLLDGVPTRVWEVRPKSDDELYPSPEASTVASAQMTAQSQVAAGASPEQIAAMAGLYPNWSGGGVAYEIDNVVRYMAMSARCVQSHTSQADWDPQSTPSLWTLYRPPGVALPWVQPLGASDAYQIDELVTHQGQEWVCTLPDNVWEPGVTGWDVVG